MPAKSARTTNKFANQPANTKTVTLNIVKPGKGLSELIGRALTDNEFRTTLFKDRMAATRGYRLSKNDQATLKKLTPELVEQHAAMMRGQRSSAITIFIAISKSF